MGTQVNKKNYLIFIIGIIIFFFIGLLIGWFSKPNLKAIEKYSVDNFSLSSLLNSDDNLEDNLISEEGTNLLKKIFNFKSDPIKNNITFNESKFSLEYQGFNSLTEKYKLFILSECFYYFITSYNEIYDNSQQDYEFFVKTKDTINFEWYIFNNTDINLNFTYVVNDCTKTINNVSKIEIWTIYNDVYIYDDVIFQQNFRKLINHCASFNRYTKSKKIHINDSDIILHTDGESLSFWPQSLSRDKVLYPFQNYYWLGNKISLIKDHINITSEYDNIFDINKEAIINDFKNNKYNKYAYSYFLNFDTVINRYLKIKTTNYNPKWLIRFSFNEWPITNLKDSWTTEVNPNDVVFELLGDGSGNFLDKEKFIESYDQWKSQISSLEWDMYELKCRINFTDNKIIIDNNSFNIGNYIYIDNTSVLDANFDNISFKVGAFEDVWTLLNR